MNLIYLKMKEQDKDLLAILLIFVAIFSVYLNTLPNSFIFDDQHMIVDNIYIKNFKYIPIFFKGEITSEPIAKGMYRPILMLSFAFNYLIGRLKPYTYHMINIFIHFLNAVFLYFLLRLFLKELSFASSLGITLVFCLHPINTEAVTYISSRSDLLCSFFILSSFYAYIRSQKKDSPIPVRDCPRRGLSLYLLSLGLYIIALLTKEIGLVFLGLIAVYELIYTKEFLKNLRRLFLRFLPFVLLTVSYLILIRVIFGSVFGLFGKPSPLAEPSTFALPVRPLSANILTQASVSFYYLYLFLFPFNLCVDHNFPIITNFTNPLGSIPLILILGLVAVCLILRKQLIPIISFSCLWYFICLLPKFYARLNLVCAEHQAYLAYFALYFLLGFLFTKVRVRRIYLRQLFFFILGLFFFLTFMRNFQWRDEQTLWRTALKVNPNSDFAKENLAKFFYEKGFFEQAEMFFEESATTASSETARIWALLNLAAYYALQGSPEKGLEILEQKRDYFLEVNPIRFWTVLGVINRQMGKKEEARDVWEMILQFYPHNAKVKTMLGELYLEDFLDREKAKEYFQGAIQDDSDLILAHLGLAQALEKDDLEAAVEQYEEAIRLAPESPFVYFYLGLSCLRRQLNTQAEWCFKHAIQLNPNFTLAYYNLCLLYLSLPKPDYKQAVEYLNKAKSLGFEIDKEIEEKIRLGLSQK